MGAFAFLRNDQEMSQQKCRFNAKNTLYKESLVEIQNALQNALSGKCPHTQTALV